MRILPIFVGAVEQQHVARFVRGRNLQRNRRHLVGPCTVWNQPKESRSPRTIPQGNATASVSNCPY
jgi:hypothetical protein